MRPATVGNTLYRIKRHAKLFGYARLYEPPISKETEDQAIRRAKKRKAKRRAARDARKKNR